MTDDNAPNETMPHDTGAGNGSADMLEQFRQQRRAGAADPHRPRYHLSAPRGWLNDPNGVIYWQGRYHLFYQHNPHAAEWAAPHWGHVVSDDLVDWIDRPVALTPEMPPADDGGCWSGCAVDDGGTPTIVYTGVKGGEQTTCLAFGNATLDRWRKYGGNPVLRTPTDLEITDRAFRDPYVWRDDGHWYQVIGASIAGQGEALLYRSSDLRDWEYLGPLLEPEVRAGLEHEAHTWECPNFFALNGKYVLIVSLLTPTALSYPLALIGSFDGRRFVPEKEQRVDWGFHGFYAPLTMRDPQGRRLIWGWLQEQRPKAEQLAAGWSGAMSLPRQLWLDDGGDLRTAFVPELSALRRPGVQLDTLDVSGTSTLDGVSGHALELQLVFERHRATRSGVLLRHGADEATLVSIDWDAGTLHCNAGGSNLDGSLTWSAHSGEFRDLGETVRLHLYLDHSTLEVIANDELSLCARIYPRAPGEGTVALVSEGGETRVRTLEAWPLRPMQTVQEALAENDIAQR